MTLRKPRPAAVPLPALPKAVAYPPDSIWRTWEDGCVNVFRGNFFKRQGRQIVRTEAPAPKED